MRCLRLRVDLIEAWRAIGEALDDAVERLFDLRIVIRTKRVEVAKLMSTVSSHITLAPCENNKFRKRE